MSIKVKGLLHSAHFGTALLTAMIIAYPLTKHNISRVIIIYSAFAIMTSTMIGFLVNDLVDNERDRINKPFIPHISKTISKKQVGVFCVVLMIIFLYTMTELMAYSSTSIFLFAYFTFYIIYNYVNKINGLFKNVTIAIGFVFPYLFITSLLNIMNHNFFLLAFTFSFFMYRELLMEINDREGDLKTGLMTIPTRVSDSTARFIVAIDWLLTVVFMLVHTFLLSYNYINVNACFIIIIILAIQNLIWNNMALSKGKMRILLISMWIPMGLSVLMMKGI